MDRSRNIFPLDFLPKHGASGIMFSYWQIFVFSSSSGKSIVTRWPSMQKAPQNGILRNWDSVNKTRQTKWQWDQTDASSLGDCVWYLVCVPFINFQTHGSITCSVRLYLSMVPSVFSREFLDFPFKHPEPTLSMIVSIKKWWYIHLNQHVTCATYVCINSTINICMTTEEQIWQSLNYYRHKIMSHTYMCTHCLKSILYCVCF